MLGEPLRIGAVSYLNALPLLRGLGSVPGLVIESLPPSEVARGLAAGRRRDCVVSPVRDTPVI